MVGETILRQLKLFKIKTFVIKKDKEGNVVSRKPARPLPGKK